MNGEGSPTTARTRSKGGGVFFFFEGMFLGSVEVGLSKWVGVGLQKGEWGVRVGSNKGSGFGEGREKKGKRIEWDWVGLGVVGLLGLGSAVGLGFGREEKKGHGWDSGRGRVGSVELRWERSGWGSGMAGYGVG